MEHSWGSALGQGHWPRGVHRSPVGLRSPEGTGLGQAIQDSAILWAVLRPVVKPVVGEGETWNTGS